LRIFVIVTYDINEKRVNKVRKILKKYFTWVQNSVFEDEITFGKLEKCKRELLSVIKRDEDSVYFYEMEFKIVCNKKVLGQEKNYDSIIL